MYGGCQRQLAAPLEQGLAQLGVAGAVLDEPLAAGDDLQRPVALLVELDRVGDRLGLADQLARLGQQLDDPPLRLLDVLAGQLGPRLVGGDALGRVGDQAPVAPDNRPHRQVQLAPPQDVGEVAERADHGDARALLGVGELVGEDRHLDAEQRRGDRRAEAGLVPLVVGWATRATHAGISSGRVVSMAMSSNMMRW